MKKRLDMKFRQELTASTLDAINLTAMEFAKFDQRPRFYISGLIKSSNYIVYIKLLSFRPFSFLQRFFRYHDHMYSRALQEKNKQGRDSPIVKHYS
jgi:hypothetical protein